MRIAIFSDNFYPELGGIQDSILAMGKEFVRRGHAVAFFVPSFSARDCHIANVPFAELPTEKGIEIHRFSSVHIPSSTQQSRLVIPTFQRYRTLKKFNPDVIHTHTFVGVGLEALSAAKHLKVPLIGTNHWAVSGFQEYPFLKYRWFLRLALRYLTWYYNHCTFVTAPSKLAIHEIEKGGLKPPYEVLSNPIDITTFRAGSDTEISALRSHFGLTGPTVVFAGRLAPEKKIDVTIRALALLKKDIPNVQFAVAGHGSERKKLENLAQSLGVGSNVKFLGTLTPAGVADLFRASHVCAITSTSESQSMTLLQAMACGLPAVGVDALALPEYIQDGVTGRIVPPDDFAQVAAALKELLMDEERRKKYGSAASEFVRSKFGTPAVVDRFEKIYKEATTN